MPSDDPFAFITQILCKKITKNKYDDKENCGGKENDCRAILRNHVDPSLKFSSQFAAAAESCGPVSGFSLNPVCSPAWGLNSCVYEYATEGSPQGTTAASLFGMDFNLKRFVEHNP
jgi:hypothetical protein